MMITSRAKYTLVVYFILTAWMVLLSPSFCFDDEGQPRSFGLGTHETLCPFFVFTLGISLIVYIGLAIVLKE